MCFKMNQATYATTKVTSRNHFRMFALVVTLISLALLLSACSKSLSGTYKLVDDSQGKCHYSSVTFTSDGTMSASDSIGFTASGTYEIDGDQITFIMSFMGVSHSDTFSFETSGDSIYIGGSQYREGG